jgi:hypothetical protein
VKAPEPLPLTAGNRPVWGEVAWPFPLDQWGPGLAFRCKPNDCGGNINLYCGQKSASAIVSEIDDEVDWVGDTARQGLD